jgi:hypothetical protein
VEADSLNALNNMRARLSSAYDRASSTNSCDRSVGVGSHIPILQQCGSMGNTSYSSNTSSFTSESLRRLYERQMNTPSDSSTGKLDDGQSIISRNLLVGDGACDEVAFDRTMLSRQSSRSCSFHDDEACMFSFDL